jgi:hypothetical protein
MRPCCSPDCAGRNPEARAFANALDFACAKSGLQCAMADFMSHYAVPVAIGAVAVVLLLGLVNMMRGGSGNTSQKLMRLRVLLQFIAIVVIMFTLWIMSK